MAGRPRLSRNHWQYATREHRQTRARYDLEVQAGRAHCWRCGKWLPPGETWHLGHDDHDRTLYRGPECPRCNLTAGGRAGHAASCRNPNHDHRPRPVASQDW